MKYMVHGGFRNQPIMRVTLICTLVLLAGFWITNVLMYTQKLGFDPAAVVTYYRGAEDEFAMPRTYGSMLEVSHTHLGMMAMVLLLLTHLAIFLPWSLRARVSLVVLTFASALLGESAGWLVRFVHPGFAWLKIGAFVGLQASLGFLILALAWYLLRRERVREHSGWVSDVHPARGERTPGHAFQTSLERTRAERRTSQRWQRVQ